MGINKAIPSARSQPQRPVSAADYNLLNLGRSGPRGSKKKGMDDSPEVDPYTFYFGR
jgi:hypothetical protein